MNTTTAVALPASDNVFSNALSVDDLRERAPAIFAPAPFARLSSRYTFIQTERVLAGLIEAGFQPVDARQARSRPDRRSFVRHMIRLRRRVETVQLRDAVPEIVFLNSHDGASAYQLLIGLFRAICTNGLIVSVGAFPAFKITHRDDVVDEAIAGALGLAARFTTLGHIVEAMQQRVLRPREQFEFADRALALRFPDPATAGMPASQLLTLRRPEDGGDDLWSAMNRVQENVMRGGLSRRSTSGRLTRTRRITSIKEDLRLNGALWDLATDLLAA